MPRKMRVSAGTTTAAINLVTSIVLVGVVIAIFATLSTEFSLSLIRKSIGMQLDIQVATVETVNNRTTDIAQHFQTLFQSEMLPAKSDFDTMTPFYWGYKALQTYVSWIAYYFPEDHGHFVAVMFSKLDGGIICAANGIRTINQAKTTAQIVRYTVSETEEGRVEYRWLRNYTGATSSYLAGQLGDAVSHIIVPAAATGELVIAHSLRLCTGGRTCLPDTPGQAGIFQIWTTGADLGDNLRRSLVRNAERDARAFVTDRTGRLVAVSHGKPSVLVGSRMQYLMCDNASSGDSTTAGIGRDLIRDGVVGKEFLMHGTSRHIVSSRNILIGTDGTVWTVYYAVPTSAVYGGLRRTIGICVGIAGSLALVAALVSWAVQHVFLTKPLSRAVSTINTLARLNMNGIAEATLPLGAVSTDATQPKRPEPQSSDEQHHSLKRNRPTGPAVMGNFLNEVSGVLQAADKMVHSLYCVGRYVSMDLATWVIGQEVLSSPLQPRDVSVLFCDIEGSTAMIDKCRAEDTMAEFAELLNEILTALANTAKQFGGYIDKFIGDEVMVVFNAPCECPAHECRACEAAVAMQNCIEEMGREWESQGKYRSFRCPRVRVSVASGTVLVGDIGAFGTLVNYTAIGEVVCIAARLQEVAKYIKPPSRVLVTGDTWNAAARQGVVSVPSQAQVSAIVGHSCGTTTVRGCSLPLALYTLLGYSQALDEWVSSNAAHFQRGMDALASGDHVTCADELSQVDGEYIPAVRDAAITACRAETAVLDLAKK
eukprot:m51a1_g10005 adenylate cyclase, putative (767) ;mRNA; f:87901-90265